MKVILTFNPQTFPATLPLIHTNCLPVLDKALWVNFYTHCNS